MSPLTIAIALLLCAFVIAVAYMAVDERACAPGASRNPQPNADEATLRGRHSRLIRSCADG